jgi:RNA-directed DNA polymerase
MLRSRANALVSVRRVTEINAGRKTAGVDGKTALLTSQKAELAAWVQHWSRPWEPQPVKRVFIPKANGRQRPLGIPVIADRALQAVVLGALEPEWEARFEPKSYGFRPGRGCHDAIEAIFCTVVGRNPHRRWVLDADLAAAFDRIDHDHLMTSLGTFPARYRIGRWLTAGVIEHGWLTPTREGTPQGGVVSPLMMNVALHGLEAAAGVRYYPDGRKDAGKSVPGSPVVVRYADDLVALCVSAEQAQQVKDKLAQWLAPRGLAFNEDKTRIVRLEDGFDFLGFSIRRYRNGKLLIKPSKAAVQRIRSRLAAEVRALRGANAEAVINALNPVIRGWAAYYRTAVSKEIFSGLDHYVWRLTYRWALRAHPNKPKRWVMARYFGAFHPARRDRWVFGDRDSGPLPSQVLLDTDRPAPPGRRWRVTRRPRPGQLLVHAAAARETAPGPVLPAAAPVAEGTLPRLLLHADREPQSPDEWELWLKGLRKAIRRTAVTAPGGPPDENARCLMHASCAKRRNAARAARPPQLPPEPSGLA